MVALNLDRCLVDFGGASILRMMPPLLEEGGELYDSNDNLISTGSEVRSSLGQMLSAGIVLAVFLETPRPDLANLVIRSLGLDSFFELNGIGTGRRSTQLADLRRSAGVEVDDILVLDHRLNGTEWCESAGMVGFTLDKVLDSTSLNKALDLYRDNAP